MNSAVEIGLGDMICMQHFIKTSTGIQKLMEGAFRETKGYRMSLL
jgi:hypothetical protein